MAGPENDEINKLLDQLEGALELLSEGDPQPDNTLTVHQYAELKNLSRYGAQDRLFKLFRAGLIGRESWKGRFVYFFKQPDATAQQSTLAD